MDINVLLPELLVLTVAGSSLSIAAYSSFKDKTDDKKLLLIIASCFILAFLVVFILSFTTLDNLTVYQYVLSLIFFVLIFMAVLSIIGFIIHRLIVDQKYKDDELRSAITVIESSKGDLDSSIRLFESEKQ